ncbi:preprotein translocase subunit SecE [Nakamurella endophytica]|uniref:Protein translocase subunit SecE n=1 Tax=Nakamurella endophytica TaxID=1748367 RepID=A0A917WHG2_9ACTN|nr:preprotein translocase subunit SecE [Nakamurella endophytica]GGM03605.1 hypothetical protein GCM10011594_24740 [Nakamurella endophytica]
MSDQSDGDREPGTDGGQPAASDDAVRGSARRAAGRRAPGHSGSNPIEPLDTVAPDGEPFLRKAALDDMDDAAAADAADATGTLDEEPVPDAGVPDREAAVVGAGAAGSARAAARRSVVRTGVTPGKTAATRAREVAVAPRGGLLARLRRFLLEVVAELRKVIWPSRNQMVTYTIVVIVFVVFMVALVAGLDVLFAQGVLAVFG